MSTGLSFRLSHLHMFIYTNIYPWNGLRALIWRISFWNRKSEYGFLIILEGSDVCLRRTAENQEPFTNSINMILGRMSDSAVSN